MVGIVVTPPEEASVRRAVEADADPCGAESLRLDFGASGERFETRMREACRRVTGDPEGFTRELNQNVPRIMFLFLPLVALLLQLLHLRSRRFYVEHLLFCVHFHAFFFYTILLLALLEALAATLGENAAGSLASGAGNAFGMLLLFYVPWYLYRGMR